MMLLCLSVATYINRRSVSRILNFLKMRFPIWHYLNQPILSRKSRVILNPWRFWHTHYVNFLERCWVHEYRPEQQHNS